MKKINKLISAILVFGILACSVSFSVIAVDKNDGKMDYAGLISRREKYDKYSKGNAHTFWFHKVYLRDYGVFNSTYSISRYLDNNVFDKYFVCKIDNNRSYGFDWKDAAEKEKYNKYLFDNLVKTGLPDIYWLIQYLGLSRDQVEACWKEYCANQNIEYRDWLTDGFFAGNARTVIETYMTPEVVINMDLYNSELPKYKEIKIDDGPVVWGVPTIFTYPEEILDTPLETLENWNYSDEYWYDYYSFIDYVVDDNYYGTKSTISLDHRKAPEIERRLAIYAERIGKSPETGDNGNVRAAVLATVAVLAAVIPAAVLTVRRRRED